MSVQSDKMSIASEIQIGESEEGAKNRVKSLMKPQYDKWEKSLRRSDITELERLYEIHVNQQQDYNL